MNKYQLANISDIQIAYKLIGQAKPLIMIMGYSGAMDSWPDDLILKLAENRQVIIFDHRGIARSTASETPFSIELFASDVIELMNTLKIEKADILGYSMGVSIALEMVVNVPERVNNLILLSGSCGGVHEIPPTKEAMDVLEDILAISVNDPARFYRLFFTDEWLKSNKPWQFMKVPEIIPTPKMVKRQYGALLSWKGVYEHLHKISHSVLVIGGTHDRIRPIENTHVLACKIPLASMVKLKGGHGLLWQYPQALLQIISCFLSF